SVNVKANWDIFDNLSFEPSASLYSISGIENSFQKSQWGSPGVMDNSRNAEGSHDLYWQREVDGVFTYTNTFFGNHNITGNAGFSYYDRKNYDLLATGRGGATDRIPTLNAAPEPMNVSSST